MYWPSEAVGGYSVNNGVSTAVGGATTPSAGLVLRPNFPNPFAGTTRLEIGLAVSSDVTIEIYDVAGRRVRTIATHDTPPGWRSVPFDGRDDRANLLPSGVYFYRVTAAGETVTNKMVIAR